MKSVLASLAPLATTAAVPQQTIDYRFDDIRRTVTLKTPTQQMAAQKGQRAASGDTVSTGWFSYALIASERYRAKFEIFASTDVTFACVASCASLSPRLRRPRRYPLARARPAARDVRQADGQRAARGADARRAPGRARNEVRGVGRQRRPDGAARVRGNGGAALRPAPRRARLRARR